MSIIQWLAGMYRISHGHPFHGTKFNEKKQERKTYEYEYVC